MTLHPEELMALVSGSSSYDFNEFKEHTSYINGYSSTHRVIQSFWSVVNEFSLDAQKKLLSELSVFVLFLSLSLPLSLLLSLPPSLPPFLPPSFSPSLPSSFPPSLSHVLSQHHLCLLCIFTLFGIVNEIKLRICDMVIIMHRCLSFWLPSFLH